MSRVHIITHGQGLPLVLFHGWGFDINVWTPLLPRLTTQYQLHLVDLPGFGLTPMMNWETFKLVLLEQLPERFAVAGWSMGGLYATRLAMEIPARITHLINIASSPRFVRDPSWPGVDSSIFEAFYEEFKKNPLKTQQQFLALQLQGQTELEMVSSTTSETALEDGLGVLLQWDLRPGLLHLNLPVLYLFGRLDTITPRKTLLRLQRLYPQFNYVLLPQSGHVPFLSHPEEFTHALEGFLQ